ncbi:MAG: ATP-binding protein [Chloroflexi bacterium OHK40]
MEQTGRTSLALSSSLDIEQFARRLAAMREAFLATGSTGRLQPRTLIYDSWRRCRALAVDAERNLAGFGAASDQQLAELRARNEGLLLAAGPVLARLVAMLADIGYVVALGDAAGNLLEVAGDPECRRRLARKGLLPGSNWSEATAGTNAIGTALATGRVVQLLAAEHYCAGWQDVTCTAAPIRHPGSGALVGVLDITGDYRLAQPFLSGMLAAAALEVQRGLIAGQREEQAPVRFAGVAVPPPTAQEAPGLTLPQPAHGGGSWRGSPAERLAAATSVMSSGLDLGLTLDRVAAQVGLSLGLPCAGVALLDSPDGPVIRIWVGENPRTTALGPTLTALLRAPVATAWLAHKEPVLLAGPAQLPPELVAPWAQANLGALALFPLVAPRGPFGLIAAPQPGAARWAADEVQLGQALASHAAIALENARQFTMLRAYAAHTEALNTLTVFLNTLLDPGQHLELILRQIIEITDRDAGLICLRSTPDGALTPAAVYALSVPTTEPHPPLPPALIQLVEAVDLTGQALLLCRQHESEQEAEVLVAMGVCDVVAVPLTQNTSRLGVLVVAHRRHHQMSREALLLFQTIAQQLALTLSNARLRRAASENEALREADQLKSAFLAMVTHELRSPLTAIRASVEGLLDRASPVPASEAVGLLQNISRQAGRLGRFVDQLLDLSRIEAGTLAIDREWVEVAAMLDDVLSSFQRRAPACVVERAFSPDLPLLYLDQALTVQVFWNLLENAQKYGPPQGPIRVEAFCTGARVLISVADRGPGVAPQDRTRIFNHFVRLDRDRRAQIAGSGLGLAICRGVVEAHGGQIWVDDRPGGGSVFRVALPLATPDLVALHRSEPAPPGLTTSKGGAGR